MTADEFKALSNWNKVRILSGIIPQSGDIERDNAILINRLMLCCLIARVEEGDAEQSFLDETIEQAFGSK